MQASDLLTGLLQEHILFQKIAKNTFTGILGLFIRFSHKIISRKQLTTWAKLQNNLASPWEKKLSVPLSRTGPEAFGCGGGGWKWIVQRSYIPERLLCGPARQKMSCSRYFLSFSRDVGKLREVKLKLKLRTKLLQLVQGWVVVGGGVKERLSFSTHTEI